MAASPRHAGPGLRPPERRQGAFEVHFTGPVLDALPRLLYGRFGAIEVDLLIAFGGIGKYDNPIAVNLQKAAGHHQ